LDSNIFEPFAEGTRQMLSMMLGVDGTLADDASELPRTYVSGVINLAGTASGQAALCFPEGSARRVVATMLAMDESEVDEDTLRDGVGEMVNIVAGQAKSALAHTDYHFDLGLPTIVLGHDHTLAMFRGLKTHARRVDTELGSFSLMVWLVPRTGA
jgi:chemotaxis protein CheX